MNTSKAKQDEGWNQKIVSDGAFFLHQRISLIEFHPCLRGLLINRHLYFSFCYFDTHHIFAYPTARRAHIRRCYRNVSSTQLIEYLSSLICNPMTLMIGAFFLKRHAKSNKDNLLWFLPKERHYYSTPSLGNSELESEMNIAFIFFSSSDNLPCHPMIELTQCNESFQLRICKQIGTEELWMLIIF